MAARTRRQKAALAAQSSGDESPEVNGTAQKSSPKSTKSTSRVDEAKENVYLFMPNLIGKNLRFLRSVPWFLRTSDIGFVRILSGGSDYRLAVLYAPPPSDLLHTIQCFVFARCFRRICGAVLQPVDHVRGSAGHGDGSLHDGVSPGFPELRLASLGYHIPRPDCPRHGEPLYAHVCHSQHGRSWPKPQED